MLQVVPQVCLSPVIALPSRAKATRDFIFPTSVGISPVHIHRYIRTRREEKKRENVRTERVAMAGAGVGEAAGILMFCMDGPLLNVFLGMCLT